MSRREWVMAVVLVGILALVVWSNLQTSEAISDLAQKLDAQEQARIDMMEARIIVLEKAQARFEARLEQGDR